MVTLRLILLCCLVITLTRQVNGNDDGEYLVGVGIADVTGPAADIGMMGYASPTQSARGIHTRLFSRAFIFESEGQRVVYVSADIAMCDQAIKTAVVNELQARFGPDLYTSQNVLLSGTHTHSGPAGYIQYLMYGITSLGFNHENYRAIVDGMVQSIERAGENMQPAKILFNVGELLEANINRSPTSYLANPQDERDLYTHDADKDMTLVRIEALDGTPLGSINWFAVHPTSMNNTNRLLSGDNKGYASMLFEEKMNPDSRPGQGSFVAAFGASNLGDVSPNIMGPKCIDTGLPCDAETSTCCDEEGNNCYVQKCIAFGPGTDGNMEESTKIIGERQFVKAVQLFESASEQIVGAVQFRHQFVNMSTYEVEITNPSGQKEVKSLCKAALGYSFAAGTTDGPGMFDFTQGDTSGNCFWDFIKDFLINATDELVECQKPKPVLLAVGEAYWPYEWVPSIVETQVLRVGNLYIVGVPGELTTMAGRRLRRVIENLVKEKNPEGPEPKVVIAGLSNVYTHYIATFEEYQKQRYEAASTIYGPHTLQAYLQHYPTLVESMLDGTTIEAGPSPPDLLDKQFSLVPAVKEDSTPFMKAFGDVLEDPEPLVHPGDLVKAVFVGGHPKNNAMRGGTFVMIEKEIEGSSRWKLVRTDADWDTKFHWSRPNVGSTQSHIEITWQIPEDVSEGFYRIRHFGYYKPTPEEEPRPYQGSSEVFQVSATGSRPQSHPLWNPDRKTTKSITNTRTFWNALSSSTIRQEECPPPLKF